MNVSIQTRHIWFALLLGSLGCRTTPGIQDPEYAQLVHRVSVPATSAPSPLETASLNWSGPQTLDVYVQAALAQNPSIRAARKRVEALAFQVPVAASLPDPTLGLTVQPEPVQTAAGQQEVVLAANQKLFWFGKRDTRAAAADAEAEAARADLASVELRTISQVKHAYYDLYFHQQAIQVTLAEQRLMEDIRDVAQSRYQAGNTSQQDVLRAGLEIDRIQVELLQLRQKRAAASTRLASLLHVHPTAPLETVAQLPEESLAADLEQLLASAVAARPELHARLAAIRNKRHKVALARLDYKPDVTVGVSWIDVAEAGISPVSNGRDSFLLTAGWNLPLNRPRLDANLRSAEAQAVAAAREYDDLRDQTQQAVTDLFLQAETQQELIQTFDQAILPRARQTLEVSAQAYNVGDVDFLQLIDNWRELLRYEIQRLRVEVDLRKTLAELERVVGEPLSTL